jgi:predicted esterase
VLVIALHMYGVTAAETLEKWAAAAAGCIIAVPESVEHDGDGLPCWEDDVLIHEAISTALDASRRVVHDAALPVVLAGASQGANHAVRIAVAGDIPGCRGFLASVGAPRPAQLLWPSTPSLIRGFSIAGSNDALTRGSQQRLTEALAAHGVTAHLEIVPGLGHEYPESLPRLAARAIDLILG